MNLYTIKANQKTWSGKAQNMGAAVSEAARALGLSLDHKAIFSLTRQSI